VCIFPKQRASDVTTRLDDSNERIEKLETYIRRLGGDPMLLEQAVNDDKPNAQYSRSSTFGIGSQRAEEIHSAIRNKGNASRVEKTERLLGKKRGLVEHDEQITYTDMCVHILLQQFLCSQPADSFQTNVVLLEWREETRI
jgi:hypothetical protein